MCLLRKYSLSQTGSTAEVSCLKDSELQSQDSEDLLSSGSQSSSLPEQEISIWQDEKEEQHNKRKILNDAMNTMTDGRVSPL